MHEALFSYFSGEMRAVSNALRKYLSFKSGACEPRSSQTLNISSPLFAPFDLPVRHRGTALKSCSWRVCAMDGDAHCGVLIMPPRH